MKRTILENLYSAIGFVKKGMGFETPMLDESHVITPFRNYLSWVLKIHIILRNSQNYLFFN